jgi:hypothetical protein
MAGCSATHGKTRYAGERGVYNVVIEYCAEQATRYLLERAVALVEAVIRGEEFPLQETIEEAKEIAADTELGPSTRSIVDAAERRGIPWARENDRKEKIQGRGAVGKVPTIEPRGNHPVGRAPDARPADARLQAHVPFEMCEYLRGGRTATDGWYPSL